MYGGVYENFLQVDFFKAVRGDLKRNDLVGLSNLQGFVSLETITNNHFYIDLSGL